MTRNIATFNKKFLWSAYLIADISLNRIVSGDSLLNCTDDLVSNKLHSSLVGGERSITM
ncbi:hypothetical protein BTN50_1850 [Candidatus Enterovibrio altilux]|uniref:Uncharacterized protein n=1 Tax=Candidatus Enterovibrio altilux TaxID=1927128 RepID=A0A291BB79_9GAMM|nr:hypothetical protein BTN50_1850 [Candidatus Enterovibrio luxaltus]